MTWFSLGSGGLVQQRRKHSIYEGHNSCIKTFHNNYWSQENPQDIMCNTMRRKLPPLHETFLSGICAITCCGQEGQAATCVRGSRSPAKRDGGVAPTGSPHHVPDVGGGWDRAARRHPDHLTPCHCSTQRTDLTAQRHFISVTSWDIQQQKYNTAALLDGQQHTQLNFGAMSLQHNDIHKSREHNGALSHFETQYMSL